MQKSLKKKLRLKNLARISLGLIPAGIRHRIFRNMIQLPKVEVVSKYEFKLAETKEEFEQAFRILHDEYVRSGFMKEKDHGMRITKYHSLPSTSTLIVKEKGEVIATCSVIRDTSFGFPLESAFQIDHLRKKGKRLVEVSSLAIKKSHRENSGEVLFPLLKFMYEYSINYFGVDFLVIAVNPKHIEFYESLLTFKILEQKPVDSYEFANGAPAVGAVLDLRKAYIDFEQIYGKKKHEKNLFHFMTKLKAPSFHFPERRFKTISDYSMTPRLIDHFFRKVEDGFSEFSDKQLAIIRTIYTTTDFLDLIPEPNVEIFSYSQRRDNRYDVKLDGEIVFSPERKVGITVLNASAGGFKGVLDSEIRIGESIQFELRISDKWSCKIEAVPVRIAEEGVYGFEVTDRSDGWDTFIGYLESQEKQVILKAS